MKHTNDGWFIIPFAEKVQRVSSKDGVPLPDYFGKLLQYFINKIRPMYIQKDSNILSVFVNENGDPLSKFIPSLFY